MKRVLSLILCVGILLGLLPGALAEAENNGIPVIRLEIGADEFNRVLESPDHSYRAHGGTLSVEIPEGWTGEFGPVQELKDLALDYIRGRGNSTWLNAKKPFRFKLEKGADLLGMGSNKHWVLLANACDATLLRNTLMSYAGRAFGLEYTPKMVPADLYVNGSYMGSYVLAEHIRIGKNRVNIGDNGFLLSMEPYEEEPEENVFATSRGERFLSEDPDFTETPAGDRKAFLADFLQKTEDAIFSGAAAEYMDLRSAAKYWWIEQFYINGDGAYTPSTYLYITEGKLYWGPLWDFDLAPYVGDMGDPESAQGFDTIRTLWIDRLRAFDEGFRQILAEEWNNLAPILEGMAADGGAIDRYAEEIRASREQNDAYGYGDEAVWTGEPEALIAGMKDWYRQRIAWISGHLEELGSAKACVYFYADGDYLSTAEVLLNPGTLAEGDFPPDPVKEGFTFEGWADEKGNLLAPGGTVIGETSVNAVFAPEK